MPETPEATSTDPMVTPELLELAFGKQPDAEPNASDSTASTPEGESAADAEQVRAPDTDVKTPDPADDTEANAETPPSDGTQETEVTEVAGLDWAAEDKKLHATLEAISKGEITDPKDALETLKSRVMMSRGFGKKKREVAAQAKENEALIRDGQEFRKLLEDQATREAWFEFQQSKQAPESVSESEATPEIDMDKIREMSDEEYLAYQQKLAADAAVKAVREDRDRETSEQEALQQKAVTVIKSAESVHADDYPDLSDEDFESACALLNDEIRSYNLNPWDVLTGPEVFKEKVAKHIATVEAKKEVERLRAETAAADNLTREARRAASASTSPGTSAREAIDTSTAAGRLALAKAQMPELDWD